MDDIQSIWNLFRPFDAEYFNEEVRDEDDEESKARLKLRVSNKSFSLVEYFCLSDRK